MATYPSSASVRTEVKITATYGGVGVRAMAAQFSVPTPAVSHQTTVMFRRGRAGMFRQAGQELAGRPTKEEAIERIEAALADLGTDANKI